MTFVLFVGKIDLMQKVLTAEQMREVDRLTTERYGIPSIVLMENAAHAVERVITEKLGGSVKGKSILILCGKGNNGGDGLALARILAADGAIVEAYLFCRSSDLTGDPLVNFNRIAEDPSVAVGVKEFTDTRSFWEDVGSESRVRDRKPKFDILVDAVFGSGLTRPLTNPFDFIVEAYNESFANGWIRPVLISIDLPSGLASDSSDIVGSTFFSDVTVALSAPKPANVLAPASRFNGELHIADIGSPQELIEEQPSQLYLAEQSDASKWLRRSSFTSDSYKNKRGHALVIAGSEDYSGAAVLAGNAAMRSGVGLVTLAVPRAVKSEVAARALPDLIVRPFGEGHEIDFAADAILIGCGLDANDAANEAMFCELVEDRTTPVIVDAGALWFVNDRRVSTPHVSNGSNENEVGSSCANWPPAHAGSSDLPPLILTPHEGEFLRLLGTDDKNVIADRVGAVRDFSTANNVILVLKGERVLIGSPDGRVVVNPTGNSGLGKAGNGDTLAGILVGFTAQAAKMDIDIFETVVAAVYIAGMAGDIAKNKYCKRVMTASDVRECLVEVFAELENS